MSEPGTERAIVAAVESRVEHVVVQRTARYVVLGQPAPAVQEVWFALHGYGQLAVDFARAMSPVADERRLVVVPEALSRFYLESPVRGSHMTARVGATWMTREDRDSEIADHVAYLDALHERIRASLPPQARLVVLGFSQGVATAARWLTRGRTHADQVILWAGQLPDDVDARTLAAPDRATRIDFVLGERDDLIPADGVERTTTRLAASGARYERHAFPGGHRLDRETLLRLSARG